MRIALVVVAVLLSARGAAAEPILVFSWDLSRFHFGLAASHGSDYLYGVEIQRGGVIENDVWGPGSFLPALRAEAGPLVEQISETVNGFTTTTYTYDGGLFWMALSLRNVVTNETVAGGFSAPILGKMKAVVFERDEPDEWDAVDLSYQLGPGEFDEVVAKALGVPTKTRGGFVSDPYLIFGDGDATSPERFSFDGVPEVTIVAAEPALLLLVGLSVAGALTRHRKSH